MKASSIVVVAACKATRDTLSLWKRFQIKRFQLHDGGCCDTPRRAPTVSHRERDTAAG